MAQKSRNITDYQEAPQSSWDKFGNFSLTFTKVPLFKESFSQNTFNSPRINGKLVLKPQVYQSLHETIKFGLVGESRCSTVSGSTNTSVINNIYRPSRSLYHDADALKSDAIRAFYQDASAFKTNLAEMMATRKQTISMVTKAVRETTNLMRDLKRKLAGRSSRRGNDESLSAAWLELQYGWLPLLGSVYSVIEQPMPPLSRVITHRRVGRTFWDFQTNYANSFNVTGKSALTTRVTISARVTADNTFLAAAHEYGIDNPLLLRWELLPYSFVVDWFFQVGAYLEAMTAMSGLIVSDASTTTSWLCESNQTWISNISGNTGLSYSSTSGTNQLSIKEKDRVLGIPPYPLLPKFKNPLSLNHLANALALLDQAFGRRK